MKSIKNLSTNKSSLTPTHQCHCHASSQKVKKFPLDAPSYENDNIFYFNKTNPPSHFNDLLAFLNLK